MSKQIKGEDKLWLPSLHRCGHQLCFSQTKQALFVQELDKQTKYKQADNSCIQGDDPEAIQSPHGVGMHVWMWNYSASPYNPNSYFVILRSKGDSENVPSITLPCSPTLKCFYHSRWPWLILKKLSNIGVVRWVATKKIPGVWRKHPRMW